MLHFNIFYEKFYLARFFELCDYEIHLRHNLDNDRAPDSATWQNVVKLTSERKKQDVGFL